MKRSRRVLLKLMGSMAIGVVSIDLTPAEARGRRHHATARRKDDTQYSSGGFGGAPRRMAGFGDTDPSHGGS